MKIEKPGLIRGGREVKLTNTVRNDTHEREKTQFGRGPAPGATEPDCSS